jgi:predicted HTH domain antitoxin
MSLVIPDEFLQTAHISEADLKLEIAILLFQQEKITFGTASQLAGKFFCTYKQSLLY